MVYRTLPRLPSSSWECVDNSLIHSSRVLARNVGGSNYYPDTWLADWHAQHIVHRIWCVHMLLAEICAPQVKRLYEIDDLIVYCSIVQYLSASTPKF